MGKDKEECLAARARHRGCYCQAHLRAFLVNGMYANDIKMSSQSLIAIMLLVLVPYPCPSAARLLSHLSTHPSSQPQPPS